MNMKVYIQWKLVAGTLTSLIVLLIIYKVFVRYPDCGYYGRANAELLADYCNFPDKPATGQEGDVPTGTDGYRLVSVHIVVRHGDRSAIHTTSQLIDDDPIRCLIRSDLKDSVPGMDGYHETMTKISLDGGRRRSNRTYENYKVFPNEAVCARAALTPEGATQHVRNGRFLKEKYSRHRFLDSVDLRNDVLVRGTTYDRTFQSAVAFLFGFLPEFDLDEIDFEMADNNTMCTARSGLPCDCPALRNVVDVFSSTFRQELPATLKLIKVAEIYERLVAELYTEEDVILTGKPMLSQILDALVTKLCHGKALRTKRGVCLEPSVVRSVYDALGSIGASAARDETFRKIAMLKMQPLLNEIAHRMKSQAAGESRLKFVLYSGHDSTVDPLTSALGVNRGTWPPYASRVVMELFERSGRHFVRVLLDGSDVTGDLVFCKAGLGLADADLGLADAGLGLADTGLGFVGLCSLERFTSFVEGKSLNGVFERRTYSAACNQEIKS